MGHLKPRQQASKYGIQEKTGNRDIMCMYDKTRGEYNCRGRENWLVPN